MVFKTEGYRGKKKHLPMGAGYQANLLEHTTLDWNGKMDLLDIIGSIFAITALIQVLSY